MPSLFSGASREMWIELWKELDGARDALAEATGVVKDAMYRDLKLAGLSGEMLDAMLRGELKL